MKQSIPIKPFYFIRHGESEWNVINKFAGGQTDTPLTNKGIEQAKAAAYVLNKIELKPDYIAHSTMVRAEKTAFTINQNSKIKMVPYQNLRELDGGDWTGGVFTELNKRWEAGEKPNNGESLDMFANRIHTIFSTILNQPELPLIVAHGRILNAIEHGLGIKGRVLQTKNCEFLYFNPHTENNREYPWNVFVCTIKNGQIHQELAEWSQI